MGTALLVLLLAILGVLAWHPEIVIPLLERAVAFARRFLP